MSKYLCRCLLGITCLGIVTLSLSAVPSPSADTDLVCQTGNPTNCYPRIFQPTDKFQLVREGQDLPPGLHVRLNVWTGEKEARLNTPMEDDSPLENLPTEQSVIVVDQPEDNSAGNEPAMRDRVPQKPPVYEAAGKIVPPRADGNDGDSENFRRAVEVLNGNHEQVEAIDRALLDLSDLAHDIYYGVEIAKRASTLKSLVSLMESKSISQRRQAASILGGSIQNNPTALKEVLGAWKSAVQSCGPTKNPTALCDDLDLIKILHISLQQETDPAVTRAKISALAGLVKDLKMRDSFLTNAGMDSLLGIFIKDGEQWDSTRLKIAQFIMDTFLDENMGAELGVWPTEAHRKSDCSSVSVEPQLGTVDDWEHYVEQMNERGLEGREWRLEFLRLLRGSGNEMDGNVDRDRDGHLEL